MPNRTSGRFPAAALLIALSAMPGPRANADVVTDANARAAEIAVAIRVTPVAVRALAMVQVSVFDAAATVSGRYRPLFASVPAAPGASLEAAIAAANRTALLTMVPSEKNVIDADYQAALAKIPEGEAKSAGIAAGETAARAVLEARARDGADAPHTYRPRTAPGVWVPTTFAAAPHWGQRKPWILGAGTALRPGPPPSLDSEVWKRDLAEIVELGSKSGSKRTEEQTAIARFWEASAPVIYWPVARAVANAKGSDPVESARLLALVAMAMDDAVIAVFDAKYAYEFWRPVTAIRNTPELKQPGWEPLIDTPMHPEYPCAHCIVSASVGSLLAEEIGGGSSPVLRTTSPTAPGVERSWPGTAEFVKEVSEARIYDGVHYRNSTEVGRSMGDKVGKLAAKKIPRAAK